MNSFEEPTDLDRALAAMAEAQPSSQSAPADDELVAFACGDLDEARAEAVRNHLAGNPEAARRALDIRLSLAGEVPAGERAISSAELDQRWLQMTQQSSGTDDPEGSESSMEQPFALLGPVHRGFRLPSPGLAWAVAALWFLVSAGLGVWVLQRSADARRAERMASQALAERDQALARLSALESPSRAPQANTVFLFLRAAHDRVRGAELPTSRGRLELGETATFLSLAVPRDEPEGELTASFFEEGSMAPKLEVPGLRVLEGSLGMILPERFLPPGVYLIKLYEGTEATRRELADYELELVAGGRSH